MIPTHDDIVEGRTLAEIQGLTEELGAAIAEIAADELRAGSLRDARAILEGLLVTNPRDALAWALLSQVERRRGDDGTAYLCAEAAARLAPDDPQVRLARAEAHLAAPGRKEEGVASLRALRAEPGTVGARASALLRALGT
jgi:predicted Zn-dependent protease